MSLDFYLLLFFTDQSYQDSQFFYHTVLEQAPQQLPSFCLFVGLILYIPVKKFSVMSGHVFLG